jgi:hypothetical protein
VHRSSRRRFIVLITLLSHLMAALLVHVPMAYAEAMPASPVEATAASSPPCHDHTQMGHGAAAPTADLSHTMAHSDAQDHGSGCKSGLCKCPCAHAQPMVFSLSPGTPVVAHSSCQARYDVLVAPDRETAVFRPPIA